VIPDEAGRLAPILLALLLNWGPSAKNDTKHSSFVWSAAARNARLLCRRSNTSSSPP
jgi:hypothetical protein